MLRIILFCMILVTGIFDLAALLGISHVTWDGACSHKEEFGLFPFYIDGSESGPRDQCETGVMVEGLLLTIISFIGITTAIYLVWRKLFGQSQKDA